MIDLSLKLYKNKYLIAYYDSNDLPLFVSGDINEFYQFYKQFSKTSKKILEQYLSAILACRVKSKYIKFINVYEKHNDIFTYEDEVFINEIPQIKTIKDKAKDAGISLREYQRRLSFIKKIEKRRN